MSELLMVTIQNSDLERTLIRCFSVPFYSWRFFFKTCLRIIEEGAWTNKFFKSSQTSTKGEAAILKFSPHDIITLHYMKMIIADDCNIFQLSNFQPCNVFSYNQLSNFPQPCGNYNYLKNTAAAWLKPEPSTLFLWD